VLDDSDSGSAVEEAGLPEAEHVTHFASRQRRVQQDDDSPDPLMDRRELETDDNEGLASRGKNRSSTEEDGNDDLPLRRRRPMVRPTATVDSDSSAGGEEDKGLPLATPRSSMPAKRPRVHTQITLNGESEEEDDVVATPVKRRRLTRNGLASPSSSRPASKSKHSTKAQSKGASSLTHPTTLRPVKRTASSSAKKAKHKQLEILRLRRAGQDVNEEDLESSEDERNALYDTDSELEVLSTFEDDDDDKSTEEDDEEEEEEEMQPTPRRRTVSAARLIRGHEPVRETLDAYNGEDLDDFIVEDDDEPLGAPLQTMIPLEFTGGAHRPLKDHFADFVEWLLHRRLNPTQPLDDPIYTTAMRKLEDEVTGLANSKFASSAWVQDFQRALRARPILEADERHERGLLLESCQACNRKGHPATWTLRFIGKPYYSATLEDVEQASDSEDDSDGDGDADDNVEEVDEHNNIVPPEDRVWHVGVVCKSNAETAHLLMHWKKHLKEWVEERLEDDGLLQPDKVVERDRMKAKARTKLVNGILDEWIETGRVRNLWEEWKSIRDTAREKSITGPRGGRRR
jgi:hypothetical protein